MSMEMDKRKKASEGASASGMSGSDSQGDTGKKMLRETAGSMSAVTLERSILQ